MFKQQIKVKEVKDKQNFLFLALAFLIVDAFLIHSGAVFQSIEADPKQVLIVFC